MSKNFTIVRKGYSPEEVEARIHQLETELHAYKQKEQAIPHAIINAQLTADRIIETADQQAAQMRKQVVKQMEQVKKMLHDAKERVETFQEQYNHMISRYIIEFNEKDFAALYRELDEIHTLLDVEAIPDSSSFSPYAGTQAQALADKTQDGISPEEMESLLKK